MSFYEKQLAEKRGYTNPYSYHGLKPCFGGLAGELEIGDRVRVGINRWEDSFGVVCGFQDGRVLVECEGVIESFNRSHVVFEPEESEVVSRRDAIQAEWNAEERAKRCKWAWSTFSWPTFSDSFAGGF